MDDIFRIGRGTHRDPRVDTRLSTREPALASIARRWFTTIRAAGDDVTELMHDGCPTACLDDAPFAYVNVFRAHVNVGFFRGAELDDPAGLLEGRGRNMRHVKLRPTGPIDEPALEALIGAAYAHMQLCLEPFRR